MPQKRIAKKVAMKKSQKIMAKERVYRFRLMGVPPAKSTKEIPCDPKEKIFQIKRQVARAYGIQPYLVLQLVFHYKVLPDTMSLGEIGIDPKKEFIFITATQAGG